MKSILLSLLIVSTSFAEQPIPVFSKNPVKNKMLMKKWIDSIGKSYAKKDSINKVNLGKK